MTPDSDDDLKLVLLYAGVLPEAASDADLTLADNMLHQANGDKRLAARYYRAYCETHRRTP
jgi:hypothetical protein